MNSLPQLAYSLSIASFSLSLSLYLTCTHPHARMHSSQSPCICDVGMAYSLQGCGIVLKSDIDKRDRDFARVGRTAAQPVVSSLFIHSVGNMCRSEPALERVDGGPGVAPACVMCLTSR